MLITLLLYIPISKSAKSSSSSTTTSSTSDLGRRRILSELREIRKEGLSFDVPFNSSSPLECGIRLGPHHNLLEWHFSFTGIADTPYAHGIYHGRIRLPSNYPRSAPSICMITPNGRWEVGKDICLSATAHHQETWTPQWNLRTLIMALRGHIITQPREIGSILTTAERQMDLAKLSQKFICPLCGLQHENLLQSNIQIDCSQSNNDNDKKITIKSSSSSSSSLLSSTRTTTSTTKLTSTEMKKMKRKMIEIQAKQYNIYMKKKRQAIVKVLFLFCCFIAGFAYQMLHQVYGYKFIIEDEKKGLQF
jgi:ubiquitin-protein ligase